MESLQYKSVKRVMTTPYKENRVTCLTFSAFPEEDVFIANGQGTIVYRIKNNQVYKSFDQMENHLRSLENTPSTRFLARSQLSLLSSILSLLNPHAHLLLKSLEEG